MRRPAHLCGRCTEFHGEARFSNKVGHLRPHHVHAKDGATLRMSKHLAEAIRVAAYVRLGNSEEWHLARNEWHAVSLQLLCGEADRGNFGSAVSCTRLLHVVHGVQRLASDCVGCNHPLVRGGQVEVMEGDWNPGRTVILKFASFDAAKAFYNSPEYQKAKAAREGAAIMRMVCVEGL